MAAMPFISAFRALPTPAARRDALAALVGHFSADDWRHMHALVRAKSFHFDIIGALPPELVFHVFSFLDPSSPFRLQRVSRRWQALLRTTDALKPSLRAWHDGTLTFEGATYPECLQEAQSIHRFRTGRTVHDAESMPYQEGTPGSDRIVLVQDFLAQVSSNSQFREVHVTNLRSRTSWSACADGREIIERVAASDQLIAIWTTSYQKCHVFDFSGTRRAKFRLPTALGRMTACRDRTIMCGGIVNSHLEIYIWDLDSQTGKSLQLEQTTVDLTRDDAQCLEMKIIPNPQSRSFTLLTTRTCEARWCGHLVQDMAIEYHQVTFEGQLLRRGRFKIPIPGEAANLAGASVTSIRPVDRRGGFCVKVFARYNHNGHASGFYFNERLQEFAEPDYVDPKNTKLWSEHVQTAWWKDSFYQVRVHDLQRAGKDLMCMAFEHLGTSGKPNVQTPAFVDEAVVETLFAATSTNLLLNDRFAVVLALDRVYVFPFVPTPVPNESGLGGGPMRFQAA